MRRWCPHALWLLPPALIASAAAALAGAVPSSAQPVSRDVNAPAGPLLYGQTFARAAVKPGTWIVGAGKKSSLPCLTAEHSNEASSISDCAMLGGDAVGSGVLRLTTNEYQQSGFVLYDKPLNATDGLRISFDTYQFDTTTTGGADGIGFVLIDGSHSPLTAGDPGGWLGYRGLDGALLGVGLDEWGNFSNRALWGSGPDRLAPDSIVVRGAASAGYPYLVGVHTPQLAVDSASRRNQARRHVVIKISTDGLMTISVDFGHGLVPEIRNLELNNVPGQPALPKTVKFGFTAATGDHTAVHEISNLVIDGLRPDLHTTIRRAGSRFRAGGTGDLIATVSSDPSGGPTSGTVTAVVKVPGALTPSGVQGDGWSCGVAGQQAACSRPDVLAPGGSFPPIDVTTSIAPSSPRRLTVRSSADTPGIYVSPGNVGHATIKIAAPPPPPDLSVKITPVTQFPIGGTGKLRLDVSNARRAGPTVGPVTLTYKAPPGSTIIGSQGVGWTCAVQPGRSVCDRPDVLHGGSGFPPDYVTMSVCRKAGCTLKGASATALTPGTGPVTATRDLPVVGHSSLGLSLSSNPASPLPGYDVTYTAVITNSGPSDVRDASIDVRVPAGFTAQWTCAATPGSGCPSTLGHGGLHALVYVASGGTVTVTATGQAEGTAAAEVPVSARLAAPATYTDLYCSKSAPCTATGDAVAGDVAARPAAR